ncbi:MAG: hypothetical protein M1569_00805 [Candidatus Marsarchaeota archaeon]|nr:hypothetical protein [Candidatus Marsarchaeota archaeon]MCL5412927.1 hypothetical protein [Candidatus Marsarchaeota archaeon]
MKSIELLLYLQRNGMTVFNTRDIAKITGKPIGYARKTICNIGGIMRAERGVYYTEQASIYEIASNIVPFSYVSMISALRYYDIITQVPTAIRVVSPKKHRAMEAKGYKISFIRFRKGIIFGYVRRGNAFLAEPEKAILDSLYYGEYAYLDEAFEYGIRDKLIDIDKMLRYAHDFSSKALINKLGFFLEFYCNVRRDDLLKSRSEKPVYLAVNATNYNRKWGVYYG